MNEFLFIYWYIFIFLSCSSSEWGPSLQQKHANGNKTTYNVIDNDPICWMCILSPLSLSLFVCFDVYYVTICRKLLEKMHPEGSHQAQHNHVRLIHVILHILGDKNVNWGVLIKSTNCLCKRFQVDDHIGKVNKLYIL